MGSITGADKVVTDLMKRSKFMTDPEQNELAEIDGLADEYRRHKESRKRNSYSYPVFRELWERYQRMVQVSETMDKDSAWYCHYQTLKRRMESMLGVEN